MALLSRLPRLHRRPFGPASSRLLRAPCLPAARALGGEAAAAVHRPLAGKLVVTFEQAVAAPYCSSRLADAGARVIKIERPDGDFARKYDSFAKGQSSYFVWLNRGKESLVADIKADADARLIHNILKDADVFIQASPPSPRPPPLHPPSTRPAARTHPLPLSPLGVQNLAPGAAARAGFGSAELRARYPSLICVDISGYGPENRWPPSRATRRSSTSGGYRRCCPLRVSG
jgi:hypothetical protein